MNWQLIQCPSKHKSNHKPMSLHSDELCLHPTAYFSNLGSSWFLHALTPSSRVVILSKPPLQLIGRADVPGRSACEQRPHAPHLLLSVCLVDAAPPKSSNTSCHCPPSSLKMNDTSTRCEARLLQTLVLGHPTADVACKREPSRSGVCSGLR